MLCFVAFSAYAEGGDKISHRVVVVDTVTGLPLIGASVSIPGSSLTYFTDPDGVVEFQTSAEVQSVQISYISYKDFNISLNALSNGQTVGLQSR